MLRDAKEVAVSRWRQDFGYYGPLTPSAMEDIAVLEDHILADRAAVIAECKRVVEEQMPDLTQRRDDILADLDTILKPKKG